MTSRLADIANEVDSLAVFSCKMGSALKDVATLDETHVALRVVEHGLPRAERVRIGRLLVEAQLAEIGPRKVAGQLLRRASPVLAAAVARAESQRRARTGVTGERLPMLQNAAAKVARAVERIDRADASR